MKCVCCAESVSLNYRQRAYAHKDGSVEQYACGCGYRGSISSEASMFGFPAGSCPSCGRKRIKLDHIVIAVTETAGAVRFMLPKKFKSRVFDGAEARDIAEYAALGVVLTGESLRNHLCLQDPRHFQIADLRERVKPSWGGNYTSDEGVAGMLNDIHVLRSAAGNLYARAKLIDLDYSLQLLIWPKAYKAYWAYVSEFQPVVVHGTWATIEMADAAEDYTGWDNMELHVDEIQPYNYWATER